MGYAHIGNLYKNTDILMFREAFALEKIHGTSAHVARKDGTATFFSGGEKHANFIALFDPTLPDRLGTAGESLTIYGEAYGGKMQGMKDTYGPALRFVAFDVRIGQCWLSVPDAADIVRGLGLEFVHYERISTDLAAIDAQRDADSVQAIRNGVGPGKKREGIVLRPIIEVRKNNGDRIIAKHKRDDFAERRTPPAVRDRLAVLSDAEKIADEWVTPMRLVHILNKLPAASSIKHTPLVMAAMVEDVQREAAGEIVASPAVARAIRRRAAQLFKAHIKGSLLSFRVGSKL